MWSFGSICRIGVCRARSSSACAAMPGTREMMNSALATLGGMPMSPQTAAIAPSMLTGSVRSSASLVEHDLDGANHLDVLGLDLELQRHLEQPARRAGRGCGTGGRIRAAARRSRRRLLDQPLGRLAVRRPLAHHVQALSRETACSSRCRRRGYLPNPSSPAATQARVAAPVVAVLRAASVEGGVAP